MKFSQKAVQHVLYITSRHFPTPKRNRVSLVVTKRKKYIELRNWNSTSLLYVNKPFGYAPQISSIVDVRRLLSTSIEFIQKSNFRVIKFINNITYNFQFLLSRKKHFWGKLHVFN